MDSKTGAQSHYLYNSSGSIQEIQDPAAKGPQSFFWNEEQWLSGVRNDLGVHHYVYDHKGERVMKSSVMQSSVQVNDKNIDDIEYLEPYTLYINPYYVVTELQGGDKVSKHYYMNTQRVATDISINYQAQESMAGPQQPNARDPKKPSEDTTSVNYNAAFADLQATLNALGHQKSDVNGLGQQPTLEEYYPELVRETAFNSTAAKNAPESTTRVLFWYHPDYLGNVDLVTERDGKTYEFFTYNPWGEEMRQYNANTFSFSSPYRFNAKEKDPETGLHYYGARYYQSKLSAWLSVDPLAHETYEPYIYTGNNPINAVDPDGRNTIEKDDLDLETSEEPVSSHTRKSISIDGVYRENYNHGDKAQENVDIITMSETTTTSVLTDHGTYVTSTQTIQKTTTINEKGEIDPVMTYTVVTSVIERNINGDVVGKPTTSITKGQLETKLMNRDEKFVVENYAKIRAGGHCSYSEDYAVGVSALSTLGIGIVAGAVVKAMKGRKFIANGVGLSASLTLSYNKEFFRFNLYKNVTTYP
jgi:RHS repeat-associated protein